MPRIVPSLGTVFLTVLCLASVTFVTPFVSIHTGISNRCNGFGYGYQETVSGFLLRRRLQRIGSSSSLCRVSARSEVDSQDGDSYLENNVEEEGHGKYKAMAAKIQEDDAPLPPLPAFFTSETDETPTHPANHFKDETQLRIEEQQRQIDMLMNMIQNQKQETERSVRSLDDRVHPTAVAPLRVMLFIDGTWLYYSIHERQQNRCPITQAYGLGWQARYRFDWAALPRVICEAIQRQGQGWSSTSSSGPSPSGNENDRPVEVVRASVFTSVKKDTSRASNRMIMYEEMANANYDMHMMETVGAGEKCIDIQLAVEMMHYATVSPSAYDVAVLLSGDKDFLPALVRTRQKGRKVCIVSMRSACSRPLIEAPNVKDYDVIWIEDYLDELMIAKEEDAKDALLVSAFSVKKVIYDFIDKSGLEKVSSRDLGRYLKSLKIGGCNLLDEVKRSYNGIFQFLTISECFTVLKRPPREELATRKLDPKDKTYWATLHPNARQLLLAEAKETHLSAEEKEFFRTYSTEALEDGSVYFHSRHALGRTSTRDQVLPIELPEELTRDYSKYKVVELKEICKERGLLVSGTKPVLLERIQKDVAEKVTQLKKQKRAAMKRPHITGRINGEGQSRVQTSLSSVQPVPQETTQYLVGLVREYVQARGGEAGSRDLGRYLAANGSSDGGGRNTSALVTLKNLYGGLAAFISSRSDEFTKIEEDSSIPGDYEFRIRLRGR